MAKSRNAKEIVICTGCGQPYQRRVYGKADRRQICRGCCVGGINRGRTGKRNGAWKGGHQYWQEGKLGRDKDNLSWKVQRELCRVRDNHTCQDCHKHRDELGYEPHCDHVVPYRISFSHALDNLKLRCRSCHKKAEATRPELWSGKTFGGSKKTKPVCSICGKGRRKLFGGRCHPCQKDDRKDEALALKNQNLTYPEIARRMGISTGKVWHLVHIKVK